MRKELLTGSTDLENNIYQFKLILLGIEPPIWRRIQVPSSFSFWDLHSVIQDVMSWTDTYLHMFSVLNPYSARAVTIGYPDNEFFNDSQVTLPGWTVNIYYYFSKENRDCYYLYDFMSRWRLKIRFEKELRRKDKFDYPRCVSGERLSPIDISGGYPYSDYIFEGKSSFPIENQEEEALDPKNIVFTDPQIRLSKAFSDENKFPKQKTNKGKDEEFVRGGKIDYSSDLKRKSLEGIVHYFADLVLDISPMGIFDSDSQEEMLDKIRMIDVKLINASGSINAMRRIWPDGSHVFDRFEFGISEISQIQRYTEMMAPILSGEQEVEQPELDEICGETLKKLQELHLIAGAYISEGAEILYAEQGIDIMGEEDGEEEDEDFIDFETWDSYARKFINMADAMAWDKFGTIKISDAQIIIRRNRQIDCLRKMINIMKGIWLEGDDIYEIFVEILSELTIDNRKRARELLLKVTEILRERMGIDIQLHHSKRE